MPPPRRHGKRPSSRRYLVLRHGRRMIKAQNDPEFAALATAQLAPGHEILYSSDVPGLRSGSYTISINQEIVPIKETPKVKKNVPNTKKFVVFSPKYVIPSDAIYSVYPPENHSVRPEVLPHVVFNDTIVPWERYGSYNSEKSPPSDYPYNRVPWVACMPFTMDELQLSPAALKGPNSLFRFIDSLKNGATQTANMTVQMPIEDIFKLDSKQVATPFNSVKDTSDTIANLVFIKSTLFNEVFSKRDKNGVKLQSSNPDVSYFRFLSHVRKINTKGMANADEHDDELQTEREFGITVSHRTGPLKIEEPISVMAHLISIEGVEQMKDFPIQQEYVALSSLYTWTYTCLPPNSFDLAASFEALAKTRGLLRPPIPEVKPSIFGAPDDPIQSQVMSRITDGYSMVKYQVITGETTAAFMRGPFTPTKVQYPQWDLLSNSGTGLQILDQKLGLMDITYSTAWQLGRTLAMADQAYSTALSRVRKNITDPALYKSQQQALEKVNVNFKSREQLIQSFGTVGRSLATMSKAVEHDIVSTVRATRWNAPRSIVPSVSCQSPAVAQFLDDNLVEQAMKIASSPDGKDPKQPYGPPYDEYNTPYSADWVIVLRFILDLSYLVNIPAQYLITDPSHVPLESFRLFYIDQNWIDALVDGALSIGSHIDPSDDKVRRAIKKAINRYFSTPNSKLNYPPPVPQYGFYMRSEVVSKFPDLILSTNPKSNNLGTPILGRHDILDSNLMFGLLNHEPVAGETFSLTFTQPAHQQSFTAAKTLSKQGIKTSYSRIYTVANPADPDRNKPIDEHTWKRTEKDDRGAVFLWGTDDDRDDIRTLHVENLASDVYNILNTELNKVDPTFFNENLPTAAMMGIQLNDPCWQLQLEAPKVDCPPGAVAMQLTYKQARRVKQGDRTITNSVQATSIRIPTFHERAAAPQFVPRANPPHFQPILKSSILLSDEDDSDMSEIFSAVVTPTSTVASSPELVPGVSEYHADLDSLSLYDDWDSSLFMRKLSHDSMDGTGDGAAPPEFNCKVFPAANPTSSNIYMLDYPQDLIIAINYKDNAGDFKLTRLVVNVPVGNPTDAATLASTYRGPGCIMLSNLLFNVRTTYSSEEKMLKLILIPRTTREGRYVPVKNIRELSFLLRGVETYQYKAPVTSVLFTAQPEYYKQPPVEKINFRAALYPVSKS